MSGEVVLLLTAVLAFPTARAFVKIAGRLLHWPPPRPRPAAVAASTLEPPAVVNLLVNRGRLTPAAGDATLLHLAG